MMTTKKSKKSRKVETHYGTEDASAERMELEDIRKGEEAFEQEVEGLTKAQLVQLLRQARDEAAQFSSWILEKNWSRARIQEELDRMQMRRQETLKKQTDIRNENALKKVSQGSEAQALGVKDYYKLLRNALLRYDQMVSDNKPPSSTQAEAVRTIVVQMLVESDLSVHSFSDKEWIDVVKRNVNSTRIGVARNQLKKKYI